MAVATFTSVAPSTVPANGGNVTYTGAGFTGTTAVKVNGQTATFVINSDTELVVSIPATKTGKPTVVVTNASGDATDSNLITVTAYTVPAGAASGFMTGAFPTDGLQTNLHVSELYKTLSDEWGNTSPRGKYARYLEKAAKVAAVILYNKRYEPDLAVPTY